MNIGTPWQDWNPEMAVTIGVNIIISLLMICPLFYLGDKSLEYLTFIIHFLIFREKSKYETQISH